jgi:hypothetical protein
MKASGKHTSEDLKEDSLEDRIYAHLKEVILILPLRMLVSLMTFINDEVERRLKPPTLH